MSASSNLSPATHDPLLTRIPHLPRYLWLAAAVLALAAAVVPGLWSAAGLVAIIVAAVAFAWPEISVYLLALSIPLSSLPDLLKDPAGTTAAETSSASFTSNEVFVALLLVGWTARCLARRRLTIPVTPLLVPLLLVIAAVVISIAQATNQTLTLKETLKWLELLLVYLFIVAEMPTRRQILTLSGFLLAGAAIEAVVGLVQFAFGIGPEPFAIGRFMRAYGTFEQPNPYAGYLGMLLPLMLALLLLPPSKKARNVTVVVSVLVLSAIAASLSRGAWVGIGLGLAAMALFWSRRSRLLLAAGAIAAAPVGALAFLNILPAELTSRLTTVLDYFRFIDVRAETVTPDNFAVIERVAHWQAALDMIAAHPLFGVGAGNYPAVYEDYMVRGWTEPLGHAHNYYLNMAAETGIPGLILYLALLAAMFITVMVWLVRSEQLTVVSCQLSAHNSQFTIHNSFWRAILLGVLGALVAVSIHNMFDNLLVHGMSIQLGMLLGMAQVAAVSLASTASQDRDSPAS